MPEPTSLSPGALLVRAGARPRSLAGWAFASSLTLSVLTPLAGCQGTLDGGLAPPRGFECAAGCPELPVPTTRFPRLTHAEYERTVVDLLRLDGPSGQIISPADAPSGLFDNAGAELRVSSSLASSYQRAAEQLAERVATDPTALARILPEGLPASPLEARGRGFVEGFGLRAYRRPLSGDEVTRYTAFFARGPELYPDDDPFVAGVRLVLEAMLQSPHFLYRPELGAPSGETPIALGDYELASRLSYAIWGRMPDDALLDAAGSGVLDDPAGLEAEASRLLDDARAEQILVAYHEQLLDVDKVLDVSRSSMLFPEFDGSVPPAMADELRFFVRDVFENDGGVRDLFVSDFTYANEALAGVYGLPSVTGEDMRRVPLTGTERAGILTMGSFLAVNASSTDSDPIHRGVFVNQRILCAPLRAAPDTPPGLPAEDLTMPRTLRDRIDDFTGPGTCGAECHGQLINPIGFAFEEFDAVGAHRTRDRNMLEIDAAASYEFGAQTLSYDGARELSSIIAEQRSAHACYVTHLLEFVHGRPPVEGDQALLDRATRASVRDAASLRELVLLLVTSDSFRSRSPVELDELPSLSME
jgi:hypothetical protein